MDQMSVIEMILMISMIIYYKYIWKYYKDDYEANIWLIHMI